MLSVANNVPEEWGACQFVFEGTTSSGASCVPSNNGIILERDESLKNKLDVPKGCNLNAPQPKGSVGTGARCNILGGDKPGQAKECSVPSTAELQENDCFGIKATENDCYLFVKNCDSF